MKLFRSVITLTIVGSMILSAAGCEDSEAQQRDDAQVKLTQLRSDLRHAIAKGGETPEAYQASLNKIVTALDGVGSSESGQQAAKALLAAETLREIAAAHAVAAADMELAHAAELSVAGAQVDAALRLHALASGRGSYDVNQLRDSIQAQIDQAQQTATMLREQIAALEGPINERTTQNQTQGQQIEQMRIQVGTLLRQAQDRGYADGLDTYLEAKQLNRQADQIEYEVSQREIDLDHDLTPQHRMAQQQLEQVEGMVQALEAARMQVEAYSNAAADDAHASRAKIDELAGQVNATLTSVKTQADGPLNAAYEAALAALDRAATNANKAGTGGGPGANSAKMMGAGIQEAIARTHLAAARGLADRLAVLQKIKQGGGAIPMNGVDGQISELDAAIAKHYEAAKAALESASQSLEGISGGSGEVEAFRTNLISLTNALSGKAPVEAEPETDTSAAAPSGSSTPAPARVKGADSPDALLASIKSIKSINDVDRAFDLILPPTDPAARQMMNQVRSLISDAKKLDAALQSKFSQGLEALGGSMPTGNIAVTDAVIENVTETTASLSVTTNGKTQSVPLVKVDERWYIGDPNDPTGMGALGAMGAGAPGSENAPAIDADTQKAMMQMVNAMMGGIRKAVQGMTKRVSAGEFATFEDFQAAAEKAAQEAFASMMPGMPKRPPSGGNSGNNAGSPPGIGG